ncbi:MAG: hypothetical protein H6924_01360 [Alphaproteobacteria bacterium]|nr:hypothetical protein [Alphaproteobacteria bacterium]
MAAAKHEDQFGVTLREVSDEKTGVSSVVTDARGAGKVTFPDLRPAIVIVDKSGKLVQMLLGRRRQGYLARRHLTVEDGAGVHAGDARLRADRRRQDPRHHRFVARGRTSLKPASPGGSGRAG